MKQEKMGLTDSFYLKYKSFGKLVLRIMRGQLLWAEGYPEAGLTMAHAYLRSLVRTLCQG